MVYLWNRRTIRRAKPLGFMRVVGHIGTWNGQAENKLEGKTATASGKNKPQGDLQMSKARCGGLYFMLSETQTPLQ